MHGLATSSINFLNFTHVHILAEAQICATLPDQNLKGERGGWVDNSISNQSPRKLYQANRFVKNKLYIDQIF